MIKLTLFYLTIICLLVSQSYLQSIMDDFTQGEMFNNTKPYVGYTIVWGKQLGCYVKDIQVKNPNLTSKLNTSNNAVQKCWTYCAKQRFAFEGYAALQNGSNCLCSSDINNKTTYKRTDCNKTCSGNKKEICGGSNSISLYEIKTVVIG